MNDPLVSVIVVNYRTPELTRSCLDSLARVSSSVAFEAIVVDNSEDAAQTERLAGMLPWARVVPSPYNVGFGRACNLGATLARGRYLFLLNSDAAVAGDVVGGLAGFLEAHPQAAAVGCLIENPDGTPEPSAARFPTPLRILAGRDRLVSLLRGPLPALARRLEFFLEPGGLTAPTRVDWCIGAALMLRAEAFHRLGGFDPNIFLYAEELDLCKRLDGAGWEIWFTPGVRVRHLGAGSQSTPTDALRMARIASGHRYYYRKHHGPLGALACLLADISAAAAKACAWSLASLAPGRSRRERWEKACWHAAYLRALLRPGTGREGS